MRGGNDRQEIGRLEAGAADQGPVDIGCSEDLCRVRAFHRPAVEDADLVAGIAIGSHETLAKGAMTVGEMCEGAVELSDNTCANLLLAEVGGPAALTAFWRRTGDAVSRLDHNEPELNRSPPGDPHDTTTPAAMARTLRRLALGEVLKPASRERLVGWMVDCKTGDNRLRGGLPKAWRIGDKTGNNGKDASGDIALAWPKPGAEPVLICAYTQGGAPTPAQIETAFSAVGGVAAEL